MFNFLRSYSGDLRFNFTIAEYMLGEVIGGIDLSLLGGLFAMTDFTLKDDSCSFIYVLL